MGERRERAEEGSGKERGRTKIGGMGGRVDQWWEGEGDRGGLV